MSDRLAVFNSGRIEQVGHAGRGLRAAGDAVRGRLRRHLEPAHAATSPQAVLGAAGTFTVRPEKIRLAEPGRAGRRRRDRRAGPIREVVYLGPDTRYIVALDAGARARRHPAEPRDVLDRGARPAGQGCPPGLEATAQPPRRRRGAREPMEEEHGMSTAEDPRRSLGGGRARSSRACRRRRRRARRRPSLPTRARRGRGPGHGARLAGLRRGRHDRPGRRLGHAVRGRDRLQGHRPDVRHVGRGVQPVPRPTPSSTTSSRRRATRACGSSPAASSSRSTSTSSRTTPTSSRPSRTSLQHGRRRPLRRARTAAARTC